MTRRQRTCHAEALGNIFHFEIDILCFAFFLVWRAEDETLQLARPQSHRAQEKIPRAGKPLTPIKKYRRRCILGSVGIYYFFQARQFGEDIVGRVGIF